MVVPDFDIQEIEKFYYQYKNSICLHICFFLFQKEVACLIESTQNYSSKNFYLNICTLLWVTKFYQVKY